MREELLAPCGMNCGLCSNYLAMENDRRRREWGRRTAPAAEYRAETVTTQNSVTCLGKDSCGSVMNVGISHAAS